MHPSNLLSEGLTLTMFGVIFVFSLLTLLVIATSLMSWLVIWYEKSIGTVVKDQVPNPIPLIGPRKHDKSEYKPSADNILISIISAAVHKYRS